MRLYAAVTAMGAIVFVTWGAIGNLAFSPQERDVRLNNGKVVRCIEDGTMFARAISCDWASVKR